MISFFRWTCVAGCLVLLAGCAEGDWNPSGWVGGNVAQGGDVSKDLHPGFGAAPAPPPPLPSPALPVEKTIITGSGAAKVALLLPLSGPNAALGQAMLDAAQMAVFDAAMSAFELMPRDTGRAGGAATAARDAIASGAQLLIGPVFATDVTPAHDAAAPSGVSLLTLSTDSGLAGHGVYVMGFAPSAQVERVVAYAASRGAKRFAALIPSNAYGALVSEAFRDAVQRHGGTIAAIEDYDPARRDSGPHVRTLAAMKGQIDALFLPEGGSDLGLIAAQLAAAGFDNHAVHLLGTGLWDEPMLARMQGFLIGGWYAAPDPAMRANFVAGYKRTYGREPPRLATLAYDATALAAALAKKGTGYGDVALTNPNGFAGLDGIFRLLTDGTVERGLAVNELTSTGAIIIDKAPTTFASESN